MWRAHLTVNLGVPRQLLAILGRYLADPAEGVAAAGVRLLAAAVDALAPALDDNGWAAVVAALLAAASDDPLAALAPDGGARSVPDTASVSPTHRTTVILYRWSPSTSLR